MHRGAVRLIVVLLGTSAIGVVLPTSAAARKPSPAVMRTLPKDFRLGSPHLPSRAQLAKITSRLSRTPQAHAAVAAGRFGISEVAPSYAYCNTSSCPGAASGFAACTAWTSPCPAGDLLGYGLSGQPEHAAYTNLVNAGFSSVRFFIPYDAVEYWNGSGCTFSPALTTGWTDSAGRYNPPAEAWYALYYAVQAAYADGLDPMISIAPARDPWEVPAPDPTDATQANDYVCGVQGILNGLGSNLPVHEWEAFNEPDAQGTYLNGGTADNTCATGASIAGSAKAACIWRLAQYVIAVTSGHGSDLVGAGTFTHPTNSYLSKYIGLLESQGNWPALWTTHDYDDVDWSSIGGCCLDLAPFDQTLYNDYHNNGKSIPNMWITESAARLTDPTTTYQGMTVSCAETLHELDHWSGANFTGQEELGACLDGNATAQAHSEAAFYALVLSGSGLVPIQRTYWYEFQVPPNSTGWDSGLLSADGTGRASYCALVGSSCDPGSYESSDYSTPGA